MEIQEFSQNVAFAWEMNPERRDVPGYYVEPPARPDYLVEPFPGEKACQCIPPGHHTFLKFDLPARRCCEWASQKLVAWMAWIAATNFGQSLFPAIGLGLGMVRLRSQANCWERRGRGSMSCPPSQNLECMYVGESTSPQNRSWLMKQ